MGVFSRRIRCGLSVVLICILTGIALTGSICHVRAEEMTGSEGEISPGDMAGGEGEISPGDTAAGEGEILPEDTAAGEGVLSPGGSEEGMQEAVDQEQFPPVSLTVPVPEMKAHCKGKRVEFSWTADAAFYGYRIYETNEQGTTHTLRKKTRKDHWKMKGLTPGKTYYFQLRAYGRSGDRALWTDWGKPVKVMVANDNPSVFSRLRFGGALSVLHADNYGSLEKVQLAVDRKFYAVECDYNYSGGVMWCTHDSVAETTGTFEDHVRICQPGGTKLVVDLKTDYDEALNALGTYIRDNNLEDWVLIQTNNQYAMSRLNEIVGSKLEYWGLVMANYDTVYELTDNAQTYMDLGMTTVNIPKYVEGTAYVVGTQGTVQSLIDAGYNVCVFTWGEFSEWEEMNYPAWGARFLMTDNLNQM